MRTQIEAMAATQGHTQSLHTNALDEALALPTPFSARIARNTQLFLIEETGTTKVIDAWGGSYYLERLTAELAARAQGHIDEVERLGGMAKAIESGLPKLRIEEAAARTQARINSGRQTVIGVNTFAPTIERELNVLKVDAAAVRAHQIEKLKRLRAERDEQATQAALAALTEGARGRANLLQLSVEAARAKATVGEISLALEKAFGRHVAEARAVSGVYLSEAGPGAEANERVIAMTRAFAENEGRAPKIWSPRWDRTATIAGRRSSPRRSRILGSTWKSDLCSRRRRKWRRLPPKGALTSSASRRSPRAISRSCRL